MLATPVAIDFAIGALAVLFIASPLLFTSNGFYPDFTNAIWLVDNQQHAIAAHLHPTLFMHTQGKGVFNPLPGFYGGTLFAFTGALAALLGGATIPVFEAVTVAAMAAAYGGVFWLARQLGVKGALAHAPGLVFVTSAYYVANLYGAGAWAQFVAVSMLPLVLATTLRLVRGRWRALPVICLVAASALFSGSHNITLLWGSTVSLAALLVYWLLSGRSRALPWRRMLAVAGLIGLGVALNAWFLLPDVSYAHETLVSAREITWDVTSEFNTFAVIFDPLRTVPPESEAPALYVQIPLLALVWGLIAAPLCWRERRLRAGLATALIALGALLAVIMSSDVYELLPSFYQQVQYAYRLQTYVTLACAALVLLGALALTRRAETGRTTRVDRPLKVGLWLAVAFGVAVCAWQLWVPNNGTPLSYAHRAAALSGPDTQLPRSWEALNDYGDRTPPVVATNEEFNFVAAHVEDDRLRGLADFPPGTEPFATNISGGPNLVHVGGGVHVVGRTGEGYLVLKRNSAGAEPVPVDLSPKLSAPVVVGRIITTLSAAVLLVLALVAMLRGWRRRRRSAASRAAA